ncbi:uncharacterized protein [Diabrotica undecimpunctata]|uniref:uncharacterized protein n=1 Tax=Diabrotica undecimpunctata TaxID=50387 RepID=UPI003B641057
MSTAQTSHSNKAQNVLVATYKTYVRPTLEYGSEATITTSTNTISKLEVAQNTALRVITGAPKSTPIKSMEAQTGIQPIQCRREQHALTFWERQRRILPQKWDEYRQAASRLKTQTTPLTVANQIMEKYHIVLSEAAPFPAKTTLARCLPNTELLLENHNDPKHLSSDIALKKAALETIHTKYPAHEWLHIYCDGSSMPDLGRTGAGYVSTFFKGSIAVGAPLTNYDGEIAAIHEAAKNLENFHPHNGEKLSNMEQIYDPEESLQNICETFNKIREEHPIENKENRKSWMNDHILISSVRFGFRTVWG